MSTPVFVLAAFFAVLGFLSVICLIGIVLGAGRLAKRADEEQARAESRLVAEQVPDRVRLGYRQVRDLDRGAIDERRSRSLLYARGGVVPSAAAPSLKVNPRTGASVGGSSTNPQRGR